MSHRERVAWLSLIAMALTFGPYFILTAIDPPMEALPDLSALARLAITTVSQAALLGAGYLFLRYRFPEDAAAPADERDRAIGHRSLHTAYIVLIVGMILVGCVMPFHSSGWELINAAVFMIVVAEVVHNGAAVWGYRRGLSA